MLICINNEFFGSINIDLTIGKGYHVYYSTTDGMMVQIENDRGNKGNIRRDRFVTELEYRMLKIKKIKENINGSR
jgi:hypothetical protein